jgi:hypothetical protein
LGCYWAERTRKKKEGWATVGSPGLRAGKSERLGRPIEKKEKNKLKADWAEPNDFRKIGPKHILLKESPF